MKAFVLVFCTQLKGSIKVFYGFHCVGSEVWELVYGYKCQRKEKKCSEVHGGPDQSVCK